MPATSGKQNPNATMRKLSDLMRIAPLPPPYPRILYGVSAIRAVHSCLTISESLPSDGVSQEYSHPVLSCCEVKTTGTSKDTCVKASSCRSSTVFKVVAWTAALKVVLVVFYLRGLHLVRFPSTLLRQIQSFTKHNSCLSFPQLPSLTPPPHPHPPSTLTRFFKCRAMRNAVIPSSVTQKRSSPR